MGVSTTAGSAVMGQASGVIVGVDVDGSGVGVSDGIGDGVGLGSVVTVAVSVGRTNSAETGASAVGVAKPASKEPRLTSCMARETAATTMTNSTHTVARLGAQACQARMLPRSLV